MVASLMSLSAHSLVRAVRASKDVITKPVAPLLSSPVLVLWTCRTALGSPPLHVTKPY
jgi:hypothetical protein